MRLIDYDERSETEETASAITRSSILWALQNCERAFYPMVGNNWPIHCKVEALYVPEAELPTVIPIAWALGFDVRCTMSESPAWRLEISGRANDGRWVTAVARNAGC